MKKGLFPVVLVLCMALTLLLLGNASAAAGYADEELCGMAKQHYTAIYGTSPPFATVDHIEGEAVVIHLYEIVTGSASETGHTSTYDWYTVNRHTAKGTDFMGAEIDLSPYTAKQPSNGFPFLDVTETDSYYDSVNYVYQNGLFSGTSSTIFSPDDLMNRAMLVTVLHRLEGQPPIFGYSGFRDAEQNSYYSNAVTWASARGIVTGTGKDTFSPQSFITHEQLAVMLYRYAVLFRGMDSAVTANLSSNSDGNQVGDYAKKAVAWCVSKGIITGNVLSPKSNATRAEVAVWLHRLSQLSTQSGAGYKQTLEVLLQNKDGNNRSMYFDLDGDGTEELFTLYTSGQNQKAAIYSINNGKTSCLLNENAYGIASNPSGSLGIIEKDGIVFVCIHEENGGEYYPRTRDGSYRVYDISGQNLILRQELQYLIRLQASENEIAITEAGQTRDIEYSDFQSWLNSWTWKASVFAS